MTDAPDTVDQLQTPLLELMRTFGASRAEPGLALIMAAGWQRAAIDGQVAEGLA